MSLLRNKLSQLESRLQASIEGVSSRLFPGKVSTDDLIKELTAALQNGARTFPAGQRVAPNLYTGLLHPSTGDTLAEDIDQLEELAEHIRQVGKEQNLTFLCPPVVRISLDPEQIPQHIRVTAQISARP